MAEPNFFSYYLEYASANEVPTFFHRWSAIAGLGAYLGRNFSIQHGHFTVNPNIYCMLIGNPGTRKSTAIKLVKQLLGKAGYNTFAAEKTTKEKFMLDLAGADLDSTNSDSILEQNLFGEENDYPAECFIAADEFNDFFGNGNIEFISFLGTLWDYSGVYKNRIKTGKSVAINDPTISILGGNTPTGFSVAFPTEIIGQGFFSRILLVYSDPSGKQITFPPPPCPKQTEELVTLLKNIKSGIRGYAELTHGTQLLLDKIYKSWRGIPDVRFESYSNRRFTHLLKLSLIHAAASFHKEIQEIDVIYANTVLTHTEHLMPKALGEFGKAKNSDVSHKIIQVLDNTFHPITLKELWKHVCNDLEQFSQLGDLMRNLVAAEKIQATQHGFLPRKTILEEKDDGTTDFSLLTKEERKL